jgi:hypothetical protein
MVRRLLSVLKSSAVLAPRSIFLHQIGVEKNENGRWGVIMKSITSGEKEYVGEVSRGF